MTARPGKWLLIGLPGGNPLGFLAAVGTLRTATLAWPEARPTMAWRAEEGAWHPVLQVPGLGDTERLIDGLGEQLERMRNHPALEIGDDIKFEPEDFRGFAQQAQRSSASDRRYADFLAGFASEAVIEKKDEGQVASTALRALTGAGHQLFLKTMRELVAATTRQHIAEALLEPWKYFDPRLSLRWDPADDRRHALRWLKPKDDPATTSWGANRLAIEALPLFPTAPVRRQLETVGFSQARGRSVLLTWPIWESAIEIDTVRSLLSMQELQRESPPRSQLAAQGVLEVYRSQRITQGKYRNFTAAEPA